MIDIVIVGGGISGLTSYHRIKKANKNLNVKILEAKGEIIFEIQVLLVIVLFSGMFVNYQKVSFF